MKPCQVRTISKERQVVTGGQRRTSFAGCAQMLRWPEPKFLQQRREILGTQLETFRVFSQSRVHAPRFSIRLPSLWFDDECAAGIQHAVYTTEKRDEAAIAVVEMNPFRDGEAGEHVNGNAYE